MAADGGHVRLRIKFAAQSQRPSILSLVSQGAKQLITVTRYCDPARRSYVHVSFGITDFIDALDQDPTVAATTIGNGGWTSVALFHQMLYGDSSWPPRRLGRATAAGVLANLADEAVSLAPLQAVVRSATARLQAGQLRLAATERVALERRALQDCCGRERAALAEQLEEAERQFEVEDEEDFDSEYL